MAISCCDSLMAPVAASSASLSSGISRKEGEMRKALSVASATSSGVPAGVAAESFSKLATSLGSEGSAECLAAERLDGRLHNLP